MADIPINEELNRLLIGLSRSLIQYVGECWPWAEESANRSEAVRHCIDRQNESIARLADLLSARDWTIGLGTYPNYSELHYVALDFLLDKLIATEAGLVRRVEQTIEACSADADAVRLLEDILADERKNLETLEKVSNSRPAAQP